MDFDEFAVSKDDLRYFYALGITYGMNDRILTADEESIENPLAATETDDE